MSLTHFFDNEVGGSAHGVEKGGITPFGKKVLERMREKKILVDIAHVAPNTIDDILESATYPVVSSHTGARAICETPRNLKGICLLIFLSFDFFVF